VLQSGFRLSREIGVAPGTLRDLLADLHPSSKPHPLIESIESIPAREDPSAFDVRFILLSGRRALRAGRARHKREAAS
jgi:hypothetical protein